MLRALKFILASSALLALAGCGIQQVGPVGPTAVPTATPIPTLTVSGGSVAAIVNGTKIPMTLYQSAVNYIFRSSVQQGQALTTSQAGKQALGQMIEDTVALQKARALGVSPSSTKIEKQMTQYYKQGGGKAKFLATVGLDEQLFRYLLSADAAQQNLAKKLFPISSAGPVAQARHILIAAVKPVSPGEALFTRTITPVAAKCGKKILTYAQAKQVAVGLLHQLQHGAKFAKLVTKCSDDPYSATTGGYMSGPTGKKSLYPYAEQFAPNIESAVFTGRVGRYQLLGSIDGWHVVQVTSRKYEKYPTTPLANSSETIPIAIQVAHIGAWLNQAAQKAYANTTIYAKVK